MVDITRRLTRRRFLRSSAVAAAAPFVVPSSVFGAAAPSNRITMGCIGLGGMGTNDMRAFLAHDDVQVVAVCDPVRASNEYGHWYKHGWNGAWFGREAARRIVEDHYGRRRPAGTFKGCKAYVDFRRIVTRADIDAVTVVTPDHWHAPIAVMAADYGKDIYCEKPLSLTIAEGRAMVRAVRRSGVVFQTGSHRRSDASFRRLCEIVRNRRIGQPKRVEVSIGPTHRKGPEGDWKPHPVPKWFDYDMWLGPAPLRPYHADRCLYKFRFILDYSGGNITNLGAHSFDLVQWALGTDHTGPVEIEDLGGEFPPDGLFDVAAKHHLRYRYADGTEMLARTGEPGCYAKFIGTEGWIDTQWNCHPPSLKTTVIRPGEIRLYRARNHHRNFIDCIKSRRKTSAPAEVGHRSVTVCHLGNIATMLRARLRWDPAAERFTGPHATDANRLLTKPMRAPWRV